eukprot:TRINITY_DN44055_c0_g1_i1.p1 TRINITY_DN44055_c0_g1~~TRINITY_DN44055_c0_g1_i1.p1  ORF type:complete len:191 (-),score=45.19 TRINITY_DN44055_c0_g1_i1:49-621(-)
MKFPECCACDRVDKGEESFVGQGGAGNRQNYEPAADPTLLRNSADSQPEKARLQEFVKDFAKCAIRGSFCEVVDPKSGDVFAASYFLDTDLRRLCLRHAAPLEKTFAELELLQVKDIQDADAAKALLPESVLKALSRGEGSREKLAVVSFLDSSPSAFVLEGSAVDRDRFIMCLKVLRLYAQTHGASAGS